MKEMGTVTNGLSPNGINGTTCLLIESRSKKGSWNYMHKKKVKVKKGDLFRMEGFVKLTGAKLHSSMDISAFDRNDKVIHWYLYRSRTNITGEWVKVEKQFTVDDDRIRYIRFRLAGKGYGKYQFDNLDFRKLN